MEKGFIVRDDFAYIEEEPEEYDVEEFKVDNPDIALGVVALCEYFAPAIDAQVTRLKQNGCSIGHRASESSQSARVRKPTEIPVYPENLEDAIRQLDFIQEWIQQGLPPHELLNNLLGEIGQECAKKQEEHVFLQDIPVNGKTNEQDLFYAVHRTGFESTGGIIYGGTK